MPTSNDRSRRTPRSRAAELAERTKELGCLISVSRILADRRSPLSETLTRVVEEIPQGWQFPKLACVRLTWQDTQWTAPGFEESPWMMRHAIGDSARPVGSIEVAYRESPVPGASPFLPEESQLLQAIAERIGDVIELDAAQKALDKYQDQLRSLASQLAITEERQRREIATYLHDRIGQELALIKLRLESLRGHAREDADNAVIDQVCDIAAEVLRETRTLIFEISPPILHELGLTPAIEWLADSVRSQHGLGVDVDADPVSVVEEDLKSLLFRSVHELLNNVVRHAHATRAIVRVRGSAHTIRIEVEDDGEGIEPRRVVPAGTAAGFGLFSIRERLAYVGGRLEIISGAGRGVRAIIEAPLTAPRTGP